VVQTTISVLAGNLGVTTDTLRYYERLGLLSPSGRTPAGYRLYDDSSAERLRFIRCAQRTGLRLDDIRELLEVRDQGQCPCGHTQALVERRLAEVSAEMRQLGAMKRALLDLKRRNEQCMDATASEWSCLAPVEEGGDQ